VVKAIRFLRASASTCWARGVKLFMAASSLISNFVPANFVCPAPGRCRRALWDSDG
jgi:hypothetical protein